MLESSSPHKLVYVWLVNENFFSHLKNEDLSPKQFLIILLLLSLLICSCVYSSRNGLVILLWQFLKQNNFAQNKQFPIFFCVSFIHAYVCFEWWTVNYFFQTYEQSIFFDNIAFWISVWDCVCLNGELWTPIFEPLNF